MKHPAFYNHIFAWMPKNLADNEVDATNKMINLLYSNIKDTPPEGVVYGKKVSPYASKLWSDDKSFEINVSLKQQPNKRYILTGHVLTPNIVYQTPMGLGQEAYYWSYRTNGDKRSSTMGITSLVLINDGKALDATDEKLFSLRDLSKKLPSWVYIYQAPNLNEKTSAYFLNQGKILPFIKPHQN